MDRCGRERKSHARPFQSHAFRDECSRHVLAPMIQSRALTRLWRTLYGDIDGDELPRIMWLSALLCCIIGGFWLLDSLKDTVLATTVGLEFQPRAKLASVVVTLFVVAASGRRRLFFSRLPRSDRGGSGSIISLRPVCSSRRRTKISLDGARLRARPLRRRPKGTTTSSAA